MLKVGCLVAIISVSAAPAAFGQATTTPSLEVVVDAGGRLGNGWVEGSLCLHAQKVCEIGLYNTNTQEVARLGAKVFSGFEATGNGREIRRSESALAKAIRLKPTSN